MNTPAIIWDVDGTLVDTAEPHFRAWTRLAAEIGMPFTRAAFAATFGMRNPDILRKLFDRGRSPLAPTFPAGSHSWPRASGPGWPPRSRSSAVCCW